MLITLKSIAYIDLSFITLNHNKTRNYSYGFNGK